MKHSPSANPALLLDIDWEVIATLSRMMRYDGASQTLHIENGESRLSLERDGTIRAKGKRIIQTVTEDISMQAAWIDLN